jgi:hypothetical protein
MKEIKKAKTHFTGEVYTKSYDIIGGTDVMPIGVWSGPLDCMATDEYYQEFKELGLNLFVSMPTYLEHNDALMKHLALAEKYGIAGYVPYSEKYFPESQEQMVEVHKACEKYASFVGMLHRDEITYVQLWNDYVPVIRAYEQTEYAKTYGYYFNTLPMWARVLGKEFFGGHNYRTYLSAFLSKDGLACQMLPSDMYPFVGGDTLLIHNYFNQLAMQREVAYKYGVPFSMWVQCGPICARSLSETTASEEAFRWNVNVALAFGAKGISYFTMTYSNYGKGGWDDLYFSNNHDVAYANANADGSQSAIYNRFDNLSHNRWYDFVVRANTHIRAIDDVLMNSYHAGVIVYGKSPYKAVKSGRIDGKSWYELQDIQGKISLLIGCFEYKGKTALYVVRNSYTGGTNEEKAVLKFDDTYRYRIVQNTKERYETGDEISLRLQHGEGVLIVLE